MLLILSAVIVALIAGAVYLVWRLGMDILDRDE